MRILHVGLPNSIHLARWVNTLAGQGWDHHLLPVNPMEVCPELQDITFHYLGSKRPTEHPPSVRLVSAPTQGSAFVHPGIGPVPISLAQEQVLPEAIRRLAPDIVHAHGIQIAGYPVLDAHGASRRAFPPWLVSCWGSDIFHYGAQPEHAERIRAVLGSADYYVADSRRDIDLAYAFGLRGEGVHVSSVAGGFDLETMASYRQPGPTSARRSIVVKGLHQWVYRGGTAMEALKRCGDLLSGYRVVIYAYSIGLDESVSIIRRAADDLVREFGVEVVLLPRVDYADILRMHGEARISISLSLSDGTNLSFLEAIAMGSFPIQSFASATNEWAKHNETALFVGPEDVDEVEAAIRRALTDDELVDRAAEINARTVQERLEMTRMRTRMVELYERAAERRVALYPVQIGHLVEAVAGSGPGRNDAPGPDSSDPVDDTADLPPTVDPVANDRPPSVELHERSPKSAEAPPSRRSADPRLPLVTLVTPTYNRADLLPETIESILSQDYPNIEYIVLDDGSTDCTPELLRSYGDALRWERHPNMGQARTVNKGFAMARGEILGTVSSDDPLLPGAISAMVKAFLEHPEVVLAYPDWKAVDLDGKLIYEVASFDYSFVDMVRWHFIFPGPGTLFRRSVFEQVGGYDTSLRYLPDYAFFLRAGMLGPFLRVPKTLATLRSHPNTITISERGEAMAREHIRVTDTFFARTDLPLEVLAVKMEAYRNANYMAAIVCGSERAVDERFMLTDTLTLRILGSTKTSVPETSQSDILPASGTEAVVAGADEIVGDRVTVAAPRPRRNAVALFLNRGSAIRLASLRQAGPLEWRNVARQLLTKVRKAAPRDRIARPNIVAQGYDRISASRLGRIKGAIPIEWRITTRRWLSKAGR